MRMQPDNEEPEAQPEVSQVQGEGNSGSLRDVRRQRMEPQDESLMQLLQRERLPDASDLKIPKVLEENIYPTRFKYYFGAVGAGMVIGITWTLAALNPFWQRYISKAHIYMILYGMALLLMLYQWILLYRWEKRIKRQRAEIEKFWDQYFEPGKNPFKGKI